MDVRYRQEERVVDDVIVVRDRTPRTYHYSVHELIGLTVTCVGVLILIRFQNHRHVPDLLHVLGLWRFRCVTPLAGLLFLIFNYNRRIEIVPGKLRTFVLKSGLAIERPLKNATHLLEITNGSQTISWVYFYASAIKIDPSISGYEKLKRHLEAETGLRFEHPGRQLITVDLGSIDT